MNLPSLTPAEKKAAWFVFICALVGALLLLLRPQEPGGPHHVKVARTAADIRQRIVKTDHASAPRNRTGVELDLNTASEQELARLPGLGPALAHFIVQDRSAHGCYATVDDLVRVKGIGPQRLKVVSAFVYVLPAPLWVSAPTQSTPGGAR